MLTTHWDIRLLSVDTKGREPEFRAAIDQARARVDRQSAVMDVCEVTVGDTPESPLVVTTLRRQLPTNHGDEWTLTSNHDGSPRRYCYARIAAPHESPAEIVETAVEQLLLPPYSRDVLIAVDGFHCAICARPHESRWYDVEIRAFLEAGEVPLWCDRCRRTVIRRLADREFTHLQRHL